MSTAPDNGMEQPPEYPGSFRQQKLGWGQLLTQSYELYRREFWTFFRLAFLPAVFAYGFNYLEKFYINPFLWHLFAPRLSPGTASLRFLGFALTTGFSGGAVYCVISAFFFAAIAAKLMQDDDDVKHPLSDGYAAARDRSREIALIGLLIWTIFFVARFPVMFAVTELWSPLKHGPASFIAIAFVVLNGLAGLISRLGLAIPELMGNPEMKLGEALRASISKTENWELFFTAFCAKASIAGYAAYWLGNAGLNWLWAHRVLTESTFPWVVGLLYVSIAAALESPLFIAFTLLYKHLTFKEEAAVPVAVS